MLGQISAWRGRDWNKTGQVPPCSFILLWLFLLAAWSAVLICLVFTFRVNHHHCEMCRSTTLCRSVHSHPSTNNKARISLRT